jgi:hypothetical protein
MEMTGIILHVLPDIPLSQPIAPAWSPGGTWITVNPSFVEVEPRPDLLKAAWVFSHAFQRCRPVGARPVIS